MTDSVTKTIVGTCEEIEQKPGSEWVRFKINVGTQYPVTLSTKLPSLIEQARAVGTDTATWTFKESQGNENPNRPGTYYMNRWLEKVEASEHDAPPDNTGVTAAPERPQAGVHAPVAVGDKDRLVTRQTCLKVAGQLFSGKGNVEKVGEGERDNVSELIAAAARMELWVYRDIDDVPF